MSFNGGGFLEVDALAGRVDPARTVLVLGAGASVPSGAPTGAALARKLATDIAGAAISDELEETCSILELRHGRQAVVDAVRDVLRPLRPTGGLSAMPEFNWRRIYTTNFDTLVEAAYRTAKKPLAPVRSNYDYDRADRLGHTQLMKIHGCITQDVVDGHAARIVLTETDYEEYAGFREVLFRQLEMDLAAADVLVIGQSLKDRHLRDLMGEAATLKMKRGAPGRLSSLIYERDEDRAALLVRRGFSTAFGGIDEFFHALATAAPPPTAATVDDQERLLLKPVLRAAALDVDQLAGTNPDAVRLFNGRPATHADVASGLTFRRSAEDRLPDFLGAEQPQFLVILGVAGVGKTTLARRLAVSAVRQGHYAWEYLRDFPFHQRDWLDVDEQLRERKQRGFLIIDDAPTALRQVNQLAEALKDRGPGGLKLILTAATNHWRPRLKSPALFSAGQHVGLSELEVSELEDLVRLANETGDIRDLVDPAFRALSRSEQVHQLRERARADMFVCLKNIFDNEGLDTIVLREYAELEEDQQEIYRFVAALQASGGRVHRQLVLRVLDVRADEVLGLLEGLEGIVDEQDVSPELGLYAWETRHEVIALTVSRYKYANEDELYALLRRVIENINPTIHIELRTLREMCTSDFGIQALTTPERRLELYELMIEAAPGERIPRHRLVRELLRLDKWEAAEQAIRRAEEVVGRDRPLQRYKVQLEIRRAERTEGILDEDRVAMLRVAERLALQGLERHADDKLAFTAYADVGVAFAGRTGDLGVLDDALREMQEAAERLLDPQLGDDLLRYERRREQLHRASPKPAPDE